MVPLRLFRFHDSAEPTCSLSFYSGRSAAWFSFSSRSYTGAGLLAKGAVAALLPLILLMFLLSR
jgi:hypothetical protein